MKTPTRFHAALDIGALESNFPARESLVNAILKLAPQSPLFINNVVMQQAVSMLGTTFTTLKTAGNTRAASAKQHKNDVSAEAEARGANDRALLLVKTLAENGATNANDLASMALSPIHLGKSTGTTLPLVPPESIDIAMGKKGHGKVKVAAHETGTTRHRYAAEMSPDPIGATTWSALPGTGKSRRLTGKSGTSVWVRFALIRGQQQSDWSTPVLVTFP
jgi:hypothetical protein